MKIENDGDAERLEKGPLWNAVMECIRCEGFSLIELLDAPSVMVHVSAPTGNLAVFAHVDESRGEVLFRARLDVIVPDSRRQAVQDVIVSVNDQVNGKFVFGFDRAIYFETFIAVDFEVFEALPDDSLRSRLLRPMLLATIITAFSYAPHFVALIQGDELTRAKDHDDRGTIMERVSFGSGGAFVDPRRLPAGQIEPEARAKVASVFETMRLNPDSYAVLLALRNPGDVRLVESGKLVDCGRLAVLMARTTSIKQAYADRETYARMLVPELVLHARILLVGFPEDAMPIVVVVA